MLWRKSIQKPTLKIEDGEFCAVIGKCGSGKSTLLHIIALLDKFTFGEYFLNQKDIAKTPENTAAKRTKNIGFVKRDFALIEDYTALDNVMLPLYPIKAKDKKKMAFAALKKMGRVLKGFLKRKQERFQAVKNSVLPLEELL